MTEKILFSIGTALLALSAYYNYKFARIIFNFEDRIEEALDELDERYRVMSEIVSRPVFFDSIEVRKVISEISASRDVILRIANKFANAEDRDDKSKR